MLTVVIECRDQEPELAQTLSVLVAGAVEGLVSDVVVLDHGSRDGSSQVADAAGCRFYQTWDLADVVRKARGEWLLFVEPGARPQAGWVEEIGEYVTLNRQPARFSASRNYSRSLLRRIMSARQPLEHGFLVSKRQAEGLIKRETVVLDLLKGIKPKRLSSEMIPSWVARANR